MRAWAKWWMTEVRRGWREGMDELRAAKAHREVTRERLAALARTEGVEGR